MLVGSDLLWFDFDFAGLLIGWCAVGLLWVVGIGLVGYFGLCFEFGGLYLVVFWCCILFGVCFCFGY